MGRGTDLTVIGCFAALGLLEHAVRPPSGTWGTMRVDGRDGIRGASWPWAAPGLALMLTGRGVDLRGHGLRDRLDAREGHL